MDIQKIGRFIAECRKKKGLTQKQLADEIGVTDKSISKWENGKNLPESSLFIPLCECLGIQVQELLLGEYIQEEKLLSESDKLIVELAKNKDQEAFFLYKSIVFIILWPVILFFLMPVLSSFDGDAFSVMTVFVQIYSPFVWVYSLLKAIEGIVNHKNYFRYFMISSIILFIWIIL